ncbi:type II secretion system F family protein [Aeromicrobium phragmitis]|uniref:Type II secretion system F family protein n=1 Tax=Aeromicrobium phragmitis TaxID=2478914 RepID=A0A3L8PPN8_9ACTN|nr:type II secretion system F family protein [Aeromicrobium phragmitis]RLV56673.1 type II secretion system F family protein [Aeromicrobium phragmitis]
MLLIAVLLLTGSLLACAVALGLLALPDATVRRRVRRLTPGDGAARPSPNLAPPTWARWLAPPRTRQRLRRHLLLAGHPEGWTLNRLIVAKPLGLAAGGLFALVVISRTDGLLLVVAGLGIAALGYVVPDLLLYNRAIKRQEQIQRELPDLLDQVVISIEAGVGFEAALARVAQTNSGPLPDEIRRLLQDMALGWSRREAYLALAERTTVEELRGFCKAVIQAEDFGVSLATVVRTQAREMRISRRARAETRAQQVPVKILLPLVFCILPVLFVVILGPPIVAAFHLR